MTVSTISILFFGFLIGLKHAVEADHLAAVSTIVTERKSLFSSALVGGIWGLGHTIALLAVGVLVLLLDFQISERAESILELGVGIMLVFLGLNVMVKIIRGGKLHFHAHEHGGHAHVHPHLHDAHRGGGGEHKHSAAEPHTHHDFSLSPRPLFIGLIHGLAGSAGLMLLVLPTIESRAVGLLYIVVFGVGSIIGMMLMSLLVSVPLQFTALRFNLGNVLLRCAAGLFSIGLGLWIVYEKGFAGNLIG
jgi:ABC-type nickel/cobalt efflux system permease component RcnA